MKKLAQPSFPPLRPRALRPSDRRYSKSERLDLVIANAGIVETPPGLTKEMHWGSNCVGYAVMLQFLRFARRKAMPT
ncbi:hypothetical protein F4821DRAFT_264280 [Hypoxylon rubiginosum]|uniref:Uncharacterized protein n=1 Tax=Hypoxylon rubiginosum TaxID=110542 RepID=A0ACC0CP73_9PEZI|nr:hypothetical protein F4821DRAFT_264280 [Hypoxylon rubiginosum]